MPHEYGCFMMDVTLDDFESLQRRVDVDDLNEAGLDAEPHVTIKFGVAGDPPLQELIGILYEMSQHKPKKLKYKGISLFSSETRDVLKFDVVPCEELLALRNLIESKLDCSGDEHPEYLPHVTVAFLKPGAGAKYVDADAGGEISVGIFSYSSAGKKYKLRLNG
jgi:2'-5' RNA ligase